MGSGLPASVGGQDYEPTDRQQAKLDEIEDLVEERREQLRERRRAA